LILSDTVIEDDISPPEELFQEYFGLIEAACFRDLKALYDHLYKITDEPGIFPLELNVQEGVLFPMIGL